MLFDVSVPRKHGNFATQAKLTCVGEKAEKYAKRFERLPLKEPLSFKFPFMFGPFMFASNIPTKSIFISTAFFLSFKFFALF